VDGLGLQGPQMAQLVLPRHGTFDHRTRHIFLVKLVVLARITKLAQI
jgi:hypothetical protein